MTMITVDFSTRRAFQPIPRALSFPCYLALACEDRISFVGRGKRGEKSVQQHEGHRYRICRAISLTWCSMAATVPCRGRFCFSWCCGLLFPPFLQLIILPPIVFPVTISWLTWSGSLAKSLTRTPVLLSPLRKGCRVAIGARRILAASPWQGKTSRRWTDV